MRSLKYLFSIMLISLSQWSYAQATEAATAPKTDFMTWALENILVIVAVTVVALAIFILLRMMNMLLELQKIRFIEEHGLEAAKEANITTEKSLWSRIYKASTNYVPIEREQDLDLGHDYDGIRELDNSLPPWWLWMFYISIIFSGIYLYWYHFSDNGVSSIKQYEIQMEEGDRIKQAYLDKMADAINENVVTALTEPADIEAGKGIFTKSCIPCHLASGGGSVGPNLTDDYWIHGGGIKNIFKTIKYGVPDKGMISWASQLRPSEMQKVASYILTLKGTNPEGAKEAQGTIWVEETEEPK